MSRRLFVFEVFVIVNVDAVIEMDGVVLFSILFGVTSEISSERSFISLPFSDDPFSSPSGLTVNKGGI
jgi:hypothetical protein